MIVLLSEQTGLHLDICVCSQVLDSITVFYLFDKSKLCEARSAVYLDVDACQSIM